MHHYSIYTYIYNVNQFSIYTHIHIYKFHIYDIFNALSKNVEKVVELISVRIQLQLKCVQLNFCYCHRQTNYKTNVCEMHSVIYANVQMCTFK